MRGVVEGEEELDRAEGLGGGEGGGELGVGRVVVAHV